MHSDEPNHVLMRSLAHEIALGGDIDRWAVTKKVSALAAREWIELPEFRELVEKSRLEYSERLVGKIARCAERAIERLVELSENNVILSVSLAATKAIIEKWVALSVYFVQEQTYHSLGARLKVLQDARALEKRGAMSFGR